jgi:hypothetical protein
MSDKRIILAIGIISTAIFLWYCIPTNPSLADDSVTVTATVGSSISCGASASSTAFGTLTTGSVAASSPNITMTMSCNNPGGCHLDVHDAGGGGNPGLYSTGQTYLIPATTSLLAAGTEGYGVQATTTGNGSGGTLTIATVYDKTGDNVGALSTTNVVLSSSTQPITGRETVVTHKAAISTLTKAAADYSDTLTYSCTGY